MKIAISSGKGGTGKTFIATNLAVMYRERGKDVTYLDCDVEEPNGHLFMHPEITDVEPFCVYMPAGIDNERCTGCGRCVEACRYNALALVKGTVLVFPELCHACGACSLVCPHKAVIEKNRQVGEIHHGLARQTIAYHYGTVGTGEGGMSPRLIKHLQQHAGAEITILDSPPGTACPVVATIKNADYCILVADPTPFSMHDLKLSVRMCRAVGQEPGVLINRGGRRNSDLEKYLQQEKLVTVGEIPDDRNIAEVYSRGDMVADELPEYRRRFSEIADRILTLVSSGNKTVTVQKPENRPLKGNMQKALVSRPGPAGKVKELVILSGKGGTGKTSIAGCLAACADEPVISDCDVDASDLHLILNPEIQSSGDFSGGVVCAIDQDICVACGRCMQACRFKAIAASDDSYIINAMACEGCGVCGIVCPADAVSCRDAVNGTWFISDTRFGPMTHAELGFAEENSGRLVTLVRMNASGIAGRKGTSIVIIDGSPGTGCPVIASITGAHYALMITEPTVSGLHDLERILDVARHFNIPSGVVVNKADINSDMTERIRIKTEEIGADYFGEIPYDDVITLAQIERRTLIEYAPDSRMARTVREIWENVKKKLM